MASQPAALEVDLDALLALPLEEQAEEVARLKAWQELTTDNPLWLYIPHAKQRTYHEISTYIGGFLGGNRAGKSMAGTADDVIQLVDVGALPPWLAPYKRYHGEFRCRVVLPDLQYTLESALNLLRKLVPKHQLHKGSFDKAWDGRRRKLQFENGNWIDFMTHEMDLDQFGAIELERVRFDEEPPGNKGYKIFRECRMRVVSTGGDLRFTMTPLLGLSWTYYELTKDGEPKWDDRVRVVTVDMDDNPHLVEAQKREALEGLSKQERQARKSGRFVHFEGLIYDEFRKDKHVVPELPHLPDNAKLYEGIDPGLRNPAYVLVLIEDDDTMTVIDEIPPEPRTVAEMALMIHGKREQWGFKPKWTVIDPSARNKSHQTGRSDQAEYMDHGIYTLPGQNSRTAGFNRVKERLAPVDPDTGDSLEPRLYVAANCEELISQFTTYRWKERKGSEEEGKDEPVKARDHCFVAGTLVATERGEIPVEQVKIGDRVWTREGYMPVIAAAPTRDVPVRRLEWDGGSVVGSEDHPVWVEERGFIRLDAVRYGDRMLAWQGSRRSSSTASSSAAIPTPRTPTSATTSARVDPIARTASAISTRRSGRPSTVRSLPGSRSTTSTRTRSTTRGTTSCAAPLPSIGQSIGPQNALKPLAFTLTASALSPPNGTARPKVGHGTASTALLLGVDVRASRNTVNTAALSSTRFAAPIGKPSSARTPARPVLALPVGLTTSSGRAPAAAGPSPSTATARPALAPVNARGSSAAGSATVYNLTVYGKPEYLANGLLVHNCLDALRYVIMSRPQKPNKPTPAQEPLSASQEAFHASIRDKTRKKRPRLGGLLG